METPAAFGIFELHEAETPRTTILRAVTTEVEVSSWKYREEDISGL